MSFNLDNLISHINDDKKIILARRILDKIRIVEKNHTIETTDFLDPYEVRIAKSILNSFDDISYQVDGGYEEAERKIIYIYPSYLYQIEKDEVKYLSYNKNDNIKHKDVLGSILGLGIEREIVGDIIISEDYIYIFVKKHIYDFIKYNLDKISKYNTSYANVELNIPKKVFNKRKIVVSSLRLDTFLSSSLNLPRSDVNKIIKAGHVKVNFKLEDKTSINLEDKDLISVKKYGRIYFDEILSIAGGGKYLISIKIPK